MTLKEELETIVKNVLNQKWDIRDGRSVPATDQVALSGGGVRLEGTVLYADLSESSRLATDFQQRTAAKVIRAYLGCMTRLITAHGGSVTSFDGDRVMGVFVGEFKNSSAAECALKMNWAVRKLIRPRMEEHFTSLGEEGFEITHAAGIDTSAILCIRAGQRGDNDLVWIGRSPNFAAKLSQIREPEYRTFITEDVFNRLNDNSKYGKDKELMWVKRSHRFLDEEEVVYASKWTWAPM